MSLTGELRDFYRAQFREQDAALPGACVPWLRRRRAQALEQFLDSGFPTTADEDWKYTDLRTVARRRYVSAPPTTVAAAMPASGFEAHEFVFIDGRYAPQHSRPGPLPPGARVTGVAEALASDAGALEAWLDGDGGSARHGLLALNAAFLQDGALIEIRPGVELDRPIHLLFLSTGGDDRAVYCRNRIVTGAGSRATVIESYVGSGAGATLTSTVTDVVAEPGAVLEHYRLQREADGAAHLGSTRVQQARDSRYVSHALAFGARLARHEIHARLEAEGAECQLNGLYAVRGRQHSDQHTRIDHLRPRGTSREWYKGVLDDAARAVFTGRVVVHPQAQRTDAQQGNRNLLLSRDAEADSRPQLEIHADDVKCAHGEATGRIDAEQLFYLRSRGLDAARARGLLVYAFAADVLARMQFAPLRRQLAAQLAGRWLPEGMTEVSPP
jgi:Fe-S cluster assembly protein SufD